MQLPNLTPCSDIALKSLEPKYSRKKSENHPAEDILEKYKYCRDPSMSDQIIQDLEICFNGMKNGNIEVTETYLYPGSWDDYQDGGKVHDLINNIIYWTNKNCSQTHNHVRYGSINKFIKNHLILASEKKREAEEGDEYIPKIFVSKMTKSFSFTYKLQRLFEGKMNSFKDAQKSTKMNVLTKWTQTHVHNQKTFE